MIWWILGACTVLIWLVYGWKAGSIRWELEWDSWGPACKSLTDVLFAWGFISLITAACLFGGPVSYVRARVAKREGEVAHGEH